MLCLNLSVCLSLSLSQFSVNVYNPLARPVVWPVRLPVNGSAYGVRDAGGAPLACQVSVLWISAHSIVMQA